ncbi:MAG: hypothetical protein ONB27_07620 [candidate division KSB1 bacterium]|nr:hypothetical protein [candidate division KSB1 bacterium]
MKLHHYILTALAALVLALLLSCSGTQRIKVDETFSQIKPAAPLPEAIARKQPVNLYVKIENVADTRSSYKNHLDFYVNNFLIEPEQEITNVTNDYIYNLSLQPGIYKIKALYYASTGWQEKAYKILPRDAQVMIFPDKKLVLKVSLKKDAWGLPLDKVTHFDVSYEAIDQSNE